VSEVRIAPIPDFAAVEEASAEPLVGSKRETVLPAAGILIAYGDGGAGKTTLTIDAAAHLASGTSWLGFDVGRPLRILVIENEGPRGKFRERLAEKIADWPDAPFSPTRRPYRGERGLASGEGSYDEGHDQEARWQSRFASESEIRDAYAEAVTGGGRERVFRP
jgi:hypothetical protein